VNPITLLALFFGYVLVYAGIANHGAFAQNPWGGVFIDAYRGTDTVVEGGDAGGGGGNGGSPPTPPKVHQEAFQGRGQPARYRPPAF